MSMMKTCAKCGEDKALDSFSCDKSSKDGKCYYCKACAKEKTARYQENNKERVALAKKRCQEKKPDKYRATKARYRRENKDRILAYEARRQKENAVLINAGKRRRAKNLSDGYVRTQLLQVHGVKNPPQELIELKRVQLKMWRATL